MYRHWKRTLGSVCMGLFIGAGVVAPATAQVDWVATLNAPAVDAPPGSRGHVQTSDGGIVSAGTVATGEATRVRIARMSPTGAVQWERWATGGAVANSTPVWAHPDNSVTVAYQDPASNAYWCFENFSVTGDSRFRDCPTYTYVYNYDLRVALAADGDFYLASSSYQRTVRKISPLGVLRWTRTETTNSPSVPTVHGVDSAGNYFEANGTRLVIWSSTDGSKMGDVTLAGTGVVVSGSNALPRVNRDIALIRAQTATTNAMTATVTRSSATGALVWTRDLIFPGYGPTDKIRLVAADNDGTYVVRTAAVDGDSHVAKISATGALLWQKHYARVRRIVDYGTTLTAIRSDVTTATNSSDSFLFPIAAADGTLGAPMIYTRPDLFAPTEWFATSTGLLATFQGGNPFAPFGAFSNNLLATTTFIGLDTISNRWQVTAKVRPLASVQQGDCLMPRLAQSSPTAWWARTQAAASSPNMSTWYRRDAATGAAVGQTTPPAYGCGFPVTSDGGQVVVSSSATDRVKKLDATGAAVWQTTSSVYPAYASTNPLLSVSASGNTTYLVGSLVGRVSPTGAIAFEVDIGRPYARDLAVDSANNAWVVSGYSNSDGYISKVSAAGALLWSVAVDVPSCTDAIMSARLLSTDEMLVATQSCSEGRVFKLNGAGQIVWQRVVSGTSQRPTVALTAMHEDASGNVYVGGCLSNGSSGVGTAPGDNAFSAVVSWTNAGVERWTAITDLIAGASECVSSIVTNASGNVFAASSSSDTSRPPMLWSLNASGVERWRHQGVLAGPFAASTELALDASGKLVALGEVGPGSLANREVSLRRIDTATLGSNLQLKFLQVPAPSTSYRTPFTVRVGLRTTADAPATATTATVISLGVLSGNGKLGGMGTCTIAVGNSECSVTDATYDVVETGVSLLASSDGFAAVSSALFAVNAATTVTTLTALTAGPYPAFSVVRVRAAVQTVLPPANQTLNGWLNGPYSGSSNASNCTNQAANGSLPQNECDFLVLPSMTPLNAYFSAYGNNYLSSTAAPLTLVVSKVTPTLQVALDPINTFVVGDKIRLRVSLLAPNGFNATQYVASSNFTIPGGLCTSAQPMGSMADGYAGSYWNCEITAAVAGSQTIAVSFAGSADLLPAGPTTLSVTANAGAVVRSAAYIPGGTTVCSTAPSVTCTSLYPNNGWQCSGPAGADIDVFFLPASGSYTLYPDTPLRFRSVTGVVNYNNSLNTTYSYSSCAFDVDGDGARMAMTDGVLILRRMLGLTGSALTNGATHACVPRSALGISNAINLSYYDIDGDGQTLPATDGLILLRALLGFRGDALIADAVSAAATRKTYADIRNYLSGTCYFSIN